MKITKPLIITALVAGNLLAWGLVLQAQDATNTPPATRPAGPPPGPRGGMRGGPTLEQLTTALNLTDDQKPKVKAALDTRDQKMTDLRADTTLSQEDRRTKMQAIRQDMSDQMKAVLTTEQFAKWQQMAQRGRRNGPPPGGPNAGSTNAPAPAPANPLQ
jgi:Spy/CpxP family protein refolding chaperone